MMTKHTLLCNCNIKYPREPVRKPQNKIFVHFFPFFFVQLLLSTYYVPDTIFSV